MALTKKQSALIAYFRENPHATYRQAAEALGRNHNNVIVSMMNLEKAGVKTWKAKDKNPAEWNADALAKRLAYYRRVYDAYPSTTIKEFSEHTGLSINTAAKYLKIYKGGK